jgi:hypothetical protein
VIDFRYHIVSLISVFLALAIGIIVGTTQLNGAVLSDLRHQVSALKDDKHTLQETNLTMQTQLKANDGFAKSVEPDVVAGKLDKAKVLVIAAPGADAKVVSGVTQTIKDAGGAVTGQLSLTADYIDPRRAADIKDYVTSALPEGFALPSTNDAGSLGGALLADVLAAKPDQKLPTDAERQQVLAGFGTLNVVNVTGGTDIADYAVLVVSGTQKGDNPTQQAQTIAALASAMAERTKAVVVAGSGDSTAEGGVVGVVRSSDKLSDAISTVDNADRVSGQIVTVLALNRRAAGKDTGQYGVGAGADAAAPAAS